MANEVIEWFKSRRDKTPMTGARKMFNAAISVLEQAERERWRPVFDGDGEMPEVDEDGYSDYILVNFSNVQDTFDIAQYRVNEEGEGAFYSGDDENPYTDIGAFVSAWRPLPKPYQE